MRESRDGAWGTCFAKDVAQGGAPRHIRASRKIYAKA
jgi:hypothetical protein